MPVREDKLKSLKARMLELDIKEKDLKEKFILPSGRGGQKVNKTHSCVYLAHIPTGIEVKCQSNRSREINRFLARRELCDRFEEKILGRKNPEIEKIRRQKKRKLRKQKKKYRQKIFYITTMLSYIIILDCLLCSQSSFAYSFF